jgi:hypothetical protein
MKKTVLTLLAASLIAASAAPIAASAAERHHVRKMDRAPVSEQIRNANDAAAWTVGPRYDSSYVDGHAISAPAGR